MMDAIQESFDASTVLMNASPRNWGSRETYWMRDLAITAIENHIPFWVRDCDVDDPRKRQNTISNWEDDIKILNRFPLAFNEKTLGTDRYNDQIESINNALQDVVHVLEKLIDCYK